MIDALITVLTVGTILAVAFYDLNIYVCTFGLILVSTLLVIIFDKKTGKSENFRQINCKEQVNFEEILTFFNKRRFGKWNAPRLEILRGSLGQGLVFTCADVKNKTQEADRAMLIYVENNALCLRYTEQKGRYLNGFDEVKAPEPSKSNIAKDDLEIFELLYRILGNYAHTGQFSFDFQEWYLQEEEKQELPSFLVKPMRAKRHYDEWIASKRTPGLNMIFRGLGLIAFGVVGLAIVGIFIVDDEVLGPVGAFFLIVGCAGVIYLLRGVVIFVMRKLLG